MELDKFMEKEKAGENLETQSMETVKEFIDRISQIDGVEVSVGEEKENFIEQYLQKLQELGERKNKEIDIDFLRENLNRNVKYVAYVNYTDEEKALAENIFEEQIKIKDENREERNKKRETIKKEMIAQSPVGESYIAKQETGARPGQYIQGRIVYSNMSDYEQLLLSHETTHAARMEIFDTDGEHVCPDFDKLPVVTNSEEFLKQFPSTRTTAGYDRGKINAEGKVVELPHEGDMMQLMEICTESIAGMMNEKDEKTFEKFSIPTHKMSAITYLEKARNLLIMAIGSDDFIFDMLKRDTNEGYRKLNEKMRQYKETASIFEYLEICGEDDKVEQYATDMFLKRMEHCQDKDKEEQIKYFESILENEQVKNKIQQTGNNISKIMETSINLSESQGVTEQDIVYMVSDISKNKEEQQNQKIKIIEGNRLNNSDNRS